MALLGFEPAGCGVPNATTAGFLIRNIFSGGTTFGIEKDRSVLTGEGIYTSGSNGGLCLRQKYLRVLGAEYATHSALRLFLLRALRSRF